MGVETNIEWCDHTFNPWIGCTKVSDGCKHCYAEAQDRRWKKERWGPTATRTRTSESYWKQPLRWNRDAAAAGVRRRVFCASLADVFDDHPSIQPSWRRDLFAAIEATPQLDWLLLTKRPENIERFLPTHQPEWPSRNVWLGTTVENQEQAGKRIPRLLAAPAVVRFLSMEPLLGSVDVSRWMWPTHWSWDSRFETPEAALVAGARAQKRRQSLVSAHRIFVDWVIVGGESGPGARPFDLGWARSVRDQCAAAGVACFVKQLGAQPVAGDVGDIGMGIADRKGGDPSEWPADLRVRQFPEVQP